MKHSLSLASLALSVCALSAQMPEPEAPTPEGGGVVRVEGESLVGIAKKTGGVVEAWKMKRFGKAWSGDEQLRWSEGKPGDVLSIEWRGFSPGTHRVRLQLTRSGDYGQVKVTANGQIQEIDLFARGIQVRQAPAFESVEIGPDGSLKLDVQITGKNPAAGAAYKVGVDYIETEFLSKPGPPPVSPVSVESPPPAAPGSASMVSNPDSSGTPGTPEQKASEGPIPAQPRRALTDLNGRTMDSTLLEMAGEQRVRVRRESDGSLFVVDLARISPADRAFVEAWKRSLEESVPQTDADPLRGERPIVIKILVLNYAPIHEDRRLWEIFNWNDPRKLAEEYAADLHKASGGLVSFEIAEWRDLDEIYARVDEEPPSLADYVKGRREGTLKEGNPPDYPRLIDEQKVVPLIDDRAVDEVWIFGDHFFGLWEASMAGPGAFFINGGVYPEVKSRRPFAFYGFNYERGVAEMLHNTCHRTEATMNRIYGEWNLAKPQNNWEKFSANNTQSNGVAGVGTCHWPPNGAFDYDYGNLRMVDSWADDFLNYPHLTGATRGVSVATWSEKGGDHQRNYLKWYFSHLPRAPGTNRDRRLNNWWRYIYEFDHYDAEGRPKRPSR
jgi:hypothetical protein